MKFKIINFLFFFSIFLCGTGCIFSSSHSFREGDFLFQVLEGESLDDAITEVTAVDGHRSFTHCAMIVCLSDSMMVIEAIGDSVQVISIDKFYSRSGGADNVVRMRLKREYRSYIHGATSFALSLRGQPYDDEYLPDNGKWYCSELLAVAFNTSAGKEIFSFHPMTFKDPETGGFHPMWVEHYSRLGIAIPEGVEGNNPNDLAYSGVLIPE